MAWGREEAEADSPLGDCCNIQAEVIKQGWKGNSKKSKNKMVVPTLVRRWVSEEENGKERLRVFQRPKVFRRGPSSLLPSLEQTSWDQRGNSSLKQVRQAKGTQEPRPLVPLPSAYPLRRSLGLRPLSPQPAGSRDPQPLLPPAAGTALCPSPPLPPSPSPVGR